MSDEAAGSTSSNADGQEIDRILERVKGFEVAFASGLKTGDVYYDYDDVAAYRDSEKRQQNLLRGPVHQSFYPASAVVVVSRSEEA